MNSEKDLPQPQPMDHYDLIIVGAGPTGLACAIEANKRGISCLVLDKGCVVNSISNYPINMVFFTTPELLEIGDIPMGSERDKPSRNEALKYYRLVTQHFHLNVHQYEEVLGITGTDGNFQVATRRGYGPAATYGCRKAILATGYYDIPNWMEVPGEDLPKVSHYYKEAHPYFDCDVIVIGGRNSAAETALDLYRHGARVTLIHRSAELSNKIKYWVRPDIENRIRNEEIQGMFNTKIVEIRPDSVLVAPVSANGNGSTTSTIPNDFVFAMTGYRPDVEFLKRAGVEVEPVRMRPQCDPGTRESNVPGLYLAGVIIAGLDSNEIFIENGRFHGRQVLEDIARKLGKIPS
jgi:thioredoxin reductase (NADPH)